MSEKRNKKIKALTLGGMFAALSVVLSFLENAVPVSLAVPGVKLGLANIPVMYCLIFLGFREAFAAAFIKCLFALITRGATAFIMSSAGTALSLLAILLFKRIKGLKLVYVSIAGSLFHNTGQIIAAAFIMKNAYTLYELPLLMVSGIIMGYITGTILDKALPLLKKTEGL